MKSLKAGFQFIDKKEISLKGVKTIVLMGDVGCTSLNEESKKIINKILKIKTDLFIILGDLVFSGKDEEYNELINFCNERTSAPIFALCGNHDLPCYQKFLGMPSYSLVLANHVIIILNNSFAKFSKEDFSLLEDELNKHKDKKFILLFHIPPPTDLDITHMKEENWLELKNILDKHREKIECILTGHIHGFREYYLDGYHIFITGGGGAKICDLEKDTIKKHHAIKIDFMPGSKINTAVITI